MKRFKALYIVLALAVLSSPAQAKEEQQISKDAMKIMPVHNDKAALQALQVIEYKEYVGDLIGPRNIDGLLDPVKKEAVRSTDPVFKEMHRWTARYPIEKPEAIQHKLLNVDKAQILRQKAVDDLKAKEKEAQEKKAAQDRLIAKLQAEAERRIQDHARPQVPVVMHKALRKQRTGFTLTATVERIEK